MTTESLIVELDARTKKLEDKLNSVSKKMKDTEDSTKDLGGALKDTEKDGDKLSVSMKGVAGGVAKVGAAVVAAGAAFVAFAKVQAQTIRETDAMATAAGMSVEQFNKMSFVMGTVGISAEKFGDITKDVKERIGEFQNAGTGAFLDFTEAMGYSEEQAKKAAAEFEHLSGGEVLQEVVNRMEDAGLSSTRMSGVLEALASDTTRLIPLLKDGGKALDGLQNKFDEINVELSEEERKQFKDFANDVDAAQVAFVNFVNKGIAPFLPAIGKAADGIADFFARFSTRFDLEDILDSDSPEKIVNGLTDVNQLYTLLDASRDRMNQVDSWKWFGVDPDTIAEEEQKLKDIEVKIENRLTALENLGSDAGGNGTDAPTETGGTPTSSGIDATKLKEELQAYRESKQGQIEALVNQRDKDLAIAQEMTATAEERQAAVDTINDRYLDGVQTVIDKEQEILQKAEDDKNARVARVIGGIDSELQALSDAKLNEMELLVQAEQEKLALLANSEASEEEKNAKKLEIEQAYLEARRDLINDIAPETFDNEIVQERYEAELEALQQQLDSKLLKEEDYYNKVSDLKKKSADDDKKTSEKVIKWEGTATKKQIDQGIQLLDAVGGNSKKLFKVKQGLSAANAVMNTSEGVTDALAQQNYPSAAIIAATGAAQLAAILSASPGGGGSVSAPSSTAPPAASTSTAVEDTGSSIVAINDISESTTQRMVLEFNDDIIDVIARKVDQSKQDGRI